MAEIGDAGDLGKGDPAVGAGDRVGSLRELDVFLGGFEEMGRDTAALATILSAATAMAEPPTAMEREPNVPVPMGTMPVSPSTTAMPS